MPRGVAPGEATYTPEVSAEDFPRKLTPRAAPGPIGGEAEQFTDALANKYAADSAAWAGNQISAFRTKAIQDLEKQKADTSGDPTGFTEKYLAGFDKQATQLAEGAGNNPYAHSMFEKGITALRGSIADHAVQWEATQATAYRADSVKQNLTNQLPLIEAHPELADQVGSSLMDQINTLGGDPSTRLALARGMHEQVSLAAANGLARQNPAGVLHGLDNPEDAPGALKGLTDQQREVVRGRAQEEFVKNRAQAIQGVYETAGTSAGVRALAAIDKDDSIPADLKNPIRDQVNRQIDAYRAQRREQLAPELAQMETAIANDTAGQKERGQAWSLFQRGALNPTELSSVMGGIARSEKEAAKKGESLETATRAYEAGQPLDPEQRGVKKGVEQLFTSLTANTPTGGPDYANRAVDITRKVGVAPEPAISWARASLVGGDVKAAAGAADLIDRLDGANPRAVPYALDPKTKAIAGVINEAIRSGTDSAAAVEMARKNAALADADVKTLNERWRTAKADSGQPSALSARLKADVRFKPGWFTDVPQVPTAMQSEFDALTRDYFRYTGGDLKQARDLAVRDLGHVWGVSEVNGQREVMAYAPESMFPGLTADVVRMDIAKTVAEAPALKELDAKTVRLVLDSQRTARTQGAQWNLAAPDKHGLIEVLRDHQGNPLVYQLPVTHQDYGAIEKQVGDEFLQNARKARADREMSQQMREAESRFDAWGN